MSKKKPLYLYVYYVGLVASALLCIFVWIKTQGYFAKNQFTGYEAVEFHDGWVNETGETVSIPGKYEVQPDEPMKITKTITEDLTAEKSLLFRTDHTFVRAWINGEEIYHFGEKDELLFGKTPGSGWQLIPLGVLQEGDSISLEITCPYEKYAGLWRTILIGDKADLISYILWKGMGMLILTVIPLLIGLFIMIFPPMIFRQYPLHDFWSVGFAFVTISVWSFTEARTWQLYFTNHYAMQVLNFVTFALFLPEVVLALKTLGFVADDRLYRVVMTVNCTADVLMLLLQVLGIADYFETLTVLHILVMVNAFIFITTYFKWREQANRLMKGLSIFLYAVILSSASLDMLDFYVWDYFGNGFFTRIEISVLLLCTVVISTKRALLIHYENIEKKAIEKMAYTDALTSLGNRRKFDEAADRYEREKIPVTVLFADLNGLKYINDNQGHQKGDEVLKLAADSMVKYLGGKAECYRTGGDEFCALGSQSAEEMERLCIRINVELQQYEEQYQYPIGVSFGIVSYEPKERSTIQKCLMMAERKMYEYKENVYQTRERYR